MRKLVSLVLAVVMALSAIAMVACSKPGTPDGTTATTADSTVTTPETLKLGLGMYTTIKGADATADKDGSAQADVAMAAVLVDKDGKIVAVKIDVAQNKVGFTLDGKAIKKDAFLTKVELKEDYGMSKTGKVEWYLQAESLEKVIVGKTIDEVKTLVADGGKGVDAVMTAGCTITIDYLIKAVEKAVANAKPSAATASDTLKLTASTSQSVSDATAEKAGKNQVDTTAAAVAVSADKKVVAVVTDVQQVKFAFDAEGKFTTDVTAALKTKDELGTDYGMSATGKVEWNIQNEKLDAELIGKTAAELTALVAENGKGVESIMTAGCTITISAFIDAVVKAVK